MKIEVTPVLHDRQSLLKILLLADPDPKQVAKYIDVADLFAIMVGSQILGATAVLKSDEHSVELKNIAVLPAYRGRGLASYTISNLFEHYQQLGYSQMQVGTANSSIDNLRFYQKLGFRFNSIQPNYFSNYAQPIFENDIRAVDLIILTRPI
ncbi:N-acetyltransferase [Lentilactobacillus senioris]|uniref:GNAT family N-acetyltransferase n=1 Tax=Lentilactobacillus senioris TaxID=931534 RepID=UPI00227E7457|nr:N-acetyltransferase [Lentilactobacillus senioris]MCY9806597.1 N-acetyltransferase [Lentilactobacillus senioris]